MNMRFKAELDEDCQAFYVKDNRAKRWNMSDKAVTLYFRTESAAKAVADLLNKEWKDFLDDPS